MKIVFVSGCFDIIHPGHIGILRFAKGLGDQLIVGINSDDSIKALKGNKPIQSCFDRTCVLQGLRSVDFVLPFDQTTPDKLIESIEPDIIVMGSDHRGDVDGKSYASKVVYYERLRGEDLSSTGIKDRIILRYRGGIPGYDSMPARQ